MLENNKPYDILQLGTKYFDKNVSQPDIMFTRIRKPMKGDWEEYYENLDDGLRNLYNYTPDKTVFFLNFQVNNSYMIFPQAENNKEGRRTFCLILVKSE